MHHTDAANHGSCSCRVLNSDKPQDHVLETFAVIASPHIDCVDVAQETTKAGIDDMKANTAAAPRALPLNTQYRPTPVPRYIVSTSAPAVAAWHIQHHSTVLIPPARTNASLASAGQRRIVVMGRRPRIMWQMRRRMASHIFNPCTTA